ncbi:MAG TPA: universal stress protein [Rubrobacteraceae bacterium]|nr:universal stress protein [Rubrobacteraceae bacterium]
MDNLPKKILVATDGSASAATAARRAAEMARSFGAELHVVHVIPVSQPYHLLAADDVEGPTLYEEDAQRARKLLDEQVRSIEESGGRVAEAHLTTGEPDAEVLALGEELGVDMIVAGSRGLGSLRQPIGSVSSSIAAHAHCPVLVVRGE